MRLAHDRNVVRTLAANGADHSFAVSIHPRSLGRIEEHLDLLGFEDCVEGAGVLAVAIAKDETQRLDTTAQVAGEITSLPGHPLRGGVRSDAGDVKLAGAMLEERQRRQPSAGDPVHVEEVRGDDPLALGREELAPAWTGAAWSGVDAGRMHDLPDRGRRDRCPSRANSPWTLRCPHPRFSCAKRSTSLFNAAAVGGHPVHRHRAVQSHFPAIKPRCLPVSRRSRIAGTDSNARVVRYSNEIIIQAASQPPKRSCAHGLPPAAMTSRAP